DGDVSERVEALARQRGELDASLWAPEVEAQAHERTITRLWDDLRLADDRVTVLKAFPFDTLLLGSLGKVEKYDGDVYRTPCVGEPRRLSPEEWKQLLDTFQGHGFELVQSEWHHREFQPAVAEEGKPARSVFDIALHVRRREPRRFVIVRGDLRIEWSSRKDPDGRFIPREIDASRLELIDRRGDAPFRRRARMPDTANEARALGSTRAHPLIVYDLDGDGLSEIVLAGWNRLYRNLGGGRFERQDLCAFPRRIAPAGIIADFTGDGRPDFVCVGRDTHLYLYPGDGEGKFTARSRQCWPQGRLQNPTVLSAGDCDGDGDLDLWLAQYRSAYTAGQMPTPIYDANDGYPSYLLRNDGAGNFTDVTEEAGLGKKRYRRTYSASLVDLDDDGDLDLLNVGDFSGIDLYLNDGAGRFRDVTDDLVDERHNAGMAHTFADFDLDGRLDFFVIGMSSATVRRIDGLNLGRPEFPDLSRMRGVLTRGNRLYLRRGERYEEPPFSDEAARTGWSWGTSSFDFDNDGDLDLYVANGNISARSARDYCTEFWRHDVYLGNSEPDAALEQHFSAALAPLIRGEMSWNGFEHNALLMNRGGKGFLDVAFLLGVALEVDGRGVVTDDLDGDGRVDLVTSEEKTVGLRPAGQVVHVYQNRLTNDHHWVGVRLREEGGGFSPVGARVSLKTAAGRRVARIVTGDSLRSQHANTVHFGLGATGSVEWLEVRWLNGTVRRIERPEVDRYHDVRGRTGTRERPAPGER
ncbi:MAG: CRTAC1 family protein, partial [Planctomycetota bacterium]|nr:CRTAC1 family protein [Planctomycetota bacterium]